MDYKLNEGESLVREVADMEFRNETFSYIHTSIKDAKGELWTTTEIDEVNISQVYNQYRERHGFPFPEEILALRLRYGLSAAKMSYVLGMGANQYRLYEDGVVPSVSNARIIMSIRDKSTMLQYVDLLKNEMTESDCQKLRKKIGQASDTYEPPSPPSAYTGYVSESIEKLSGTVRLFVEKLGATFVTKMNKLLFYSDFIHYRNYGRGISGNTYVAMQYGPVPRNWSSLYGQLQGCALMEHIYPNGTSGTRIEIASVDKAFNALEDSEIKTIEQVCQVFGSMNAKQISDASHKEQGWIDNVGTRGAISYQESFKINSDCAPL